ncbi:MAG: DUF3352 domain-containing protein, partial [Leptolyngbyaceae cyanobacterium MAG.088]|nr:DUF3352 domain-containing protein [Leptolyngbyaceae cyanobacterium MAG.088]
FFGMGADILNEITPRPKKSLQANPAFQTLLSISPSESNGHFFLDLDRMDELQGTLPFPKLPDAPIISAIKSIGITTSVKSERSLRHDIFVELPKGRRVKPLPEGALSKGDNDAE